MPKKTTRIIYIQGITLIEVLIFTVLSSFLISNIINYFYLIQSQNMKLLDQIHDDQRGFMATTAIILLAIGILAFVLVTVSTASVYSDSVTRREMRIQKGLNKQACADTSKLVQAKDYFLNNEVVLSDFDCVIHK